MAAGFDPAGRFPAAFTTPGSASFTEFLGQAMPHLLPGRRPLPPGQGDDLAPHGTTIVALTFADGVLMAADRRATAGNMIASRHADKVFEADPYSVVGIAGTMGIGLELARLFQVELQHFEKIEGTLLSLRGKANKLSNMIAANLGAAMQGLAVVPIFAGVDIDADDPASTGCIFSYDVTGGSSQEHQFHAIGSGSVFASAALKKRSRPGVDADTAVRLAVEALFDAADEDTATGGPDVARGIFPAVMTVTTDGIRRLDEDEAGEVARAVVHGRMDNPGG